MCYFFLLWLTRREFVVINIPIAFYHKSPEEMIAAWQDIKKLLSKKAGKVQAVYYIKKHFPEYNVYYTKQLLKKQMINIPDLQLFYIAKQIQEHFGLRSLTIKIKKEHGFDFVLNELKNIFHLFTTFSTMGNYEHNSVGLHYKINFFNYVNFPYKQYDKTLFKGICFFKPLKKNKHMVSIGVEIDSQHLFKAVQYFSHEQAHAIDYILGENNQTFSKLSYRKKEIQDNIFSLYRNILSVAYYKKLALPYNEEDIIQRKIQVVDMFLHSNKFNQQQKIKYFNRIERKILSMEDIPPIYEPFIITLLAKDEGFKNFYPEYFPFLINNENPDLLHKYFFKAEFLQYSLDISEKFANTRFNNMESLLIHSLYRDLIQLIKQS